MCHFTGTWGEALKAALFHQHPWRAANEDESLEGMGKQGKSLLWSRCSSHDGDDDGEEGMGACPRYDMVSVASIIQRIE